MVQTYDKKGIRLIKIIEERSGEGIRSRDNEEQDEKRSSPCTIEQKKLWYEFF